MTFLLKPCASPPPLVTNVKGSTDPKMNAKHAAKIQYVEAVYMGEEDYDVGTGRPGHLMCSPRLFRVEPYSISPASWSAPASWSPATTEPSGSPDTPRTTLVYSPVCGGHAIPTPTPDRKRDISSLLWSPDTALQPTIPTPLSSAMASAPTTPPTKARRYRSPSASQQEGAIWVSLQTESLSGHM